MKPTQQAYAELQQADPFSSVMVSGDEAKAFTQKLSHGRVTRAAAASAKNGRQLAMTFAKHGSVVIQLKPAQCTCLDIQNII